MPKRSARITGNKHVKIPAEQRNRRHHVSSQHTVEVSTRQQHWPTFPAFTSPPLKSIYRVCSNTVTVTKAPSILATMSKQHSLSNATSWTILSTVSNTASTLLPFLSKQIEHVQFVSTLSKGRNFVRHCCRLWQQSRMLLRQSRTLLWQCCLLLRHCWRGLRPRLRRTEWTELG